MWGSHSWCESVLKEFGLGRAVLVSLLGGARAVASSGS